MSYVPIFFISIHKSFRDLEEKVLKSNEYNESNENNKNMRQNRKYSMLKLVQSFLNLNMMSSKDKSRLII